MPIPRHHSRERAPADRGHAFGVACRDAVAHTVTTYQRILAEDQDLADADVAARGVRAARAIRAFRADLADEIEGIATGARLDPALLFAVNARTELLAGGALAGAAIGECSTLVQVAPSGDRALLAQNWDFHPDLAAARVVWTIDGELPLTTFTEAGVVAKIGRNAAGLALAINFLGTDLDGLGDGVPVHVLCRAILDSCTTTDGAARLVRATPVDASICLTVAGRADDGRIAAAMIEVWPGGTEVLDVTADQAGIHTNHFLAPIAATDVLAASDGARSSNDRLHQLADALSGAPLLSVAEAGAALSTLGAQALEPVFRFENAGDPWLARCATLATLAFEVPSGGMWLREELRADAPLVAIGP